jgi:ankyrin repeat protein
MGTVTALIAAGANVNFYNTRGCSPLIAAIVGNHLSAVSALIEAGVDVNFAPPNPRDSTDRTPLDIAHLLNKPRVATILKKAKACT